MELLRKLTQAYAPSGNETKIRNLIEEIVRPYVDEMYKDNLGNLIVRKKGNGKKILFAAHMDEIGLIVNYIDKDGYLRFSPLGGVLPYCALYQRVIFENGVEGVIAHEEKADFKKDFDITKLYIDIGASSRQDALELISEGDSAVFCGPFREKNDIVTSKALDDRVGVYILIETIKNIKETQNDLYFVFTVQEELGLRGARAAANAICPDIALAIDVTDTGDTPECKRMAVRLGLGPCIKYMDNSIITHKAVNDALKASARKTGVDVQSEVLSFGGTDAGAIHTSGAGVMTGAVSIPARYIHTPCECVSMKDVRGAIKIVSDFANKEF